MYYRKLNNSIKVHLKIVPNSKKNEISGVILGDFGQEFLKVKIAAAPEDGKANKALIKFLARTWKISQSDIEIASGHAGRNKVVIVKGELEGVFT